MNAQLIYIIIYLVSLILLNSLFPVFISKQNGYILYYLYAILGLVGVLPEIHKRTINTDYILTLLIGLALYNVNGIFTYKYLQIVVLFFVCYIFSKKISSHPFLIKILVITFIFGGVLESIIALLQFFNCIHSGNVFFKVTGSFDNPGPLGGYISICLLSAISSLFYYKPNKRCFWVMSLSVVIQVIGVILSDSRAAWLSAIIGICFLFMHHFKWGWIKIVSISLITFVSFLLLSLTIYKTKSAHGRLLIWSVCEEMIKEHPICGHGFATFSQNYMPYQARYITTHPEADDILVSNNQFAFNELIHIWCEDGIIAVLAVIAIVVLIIKYNYSRKSVFFSSFVGYIVFSCFSYPFSVTLLLLILPIFLGILSVSVPTKYYLLPFNISYLLNFVFLAGILILALAFYTENKLKNALYNYYYQEKEEARKLIEDNNSVIWNSKDFMSQYAKVLYMKEEYELCIPILKQAIVLYPTTEKYIDLGNCYQILGNYSEAEYCYTYASKMIPLLIYPQYCLFVLYQETKREKEAILLARKIIHMKIKKTNETQRVMEIKRLLKQYIRERQ